MWPPVSSRYGALPGPEENPRTRLPFIPPSALGEEQRPLYADMRTGIEQKFRGFAAMREDGGLLGPWNLTCPRRSSPPAMRGRRDDGGMGMAGKRSTPEQTVAKLRQVEVLTGQGKSVAEAVRAIGVTEPTYYRWRSEYGGLKLDQVKRLKQLEAENARLRKAVADLTLEKVILKEAASGNF
jgi:putative transposase